ncbi:transcriptional regulator containing PAS, AAA-type ATPase, and DNA-binding domains [Desulfosporosinus orientis DSM 765]|uniref:Transcriptional regulator containing PAS, AAA-type ATPase, and DNA-binding domains n=1 Tax=Desulfosporosinus orientis (strain ATCC 19365 / DSM 765 / NCIMB 8382 / VKM B-1628 / Singapore I) TaxID=768706 RepID=G7W614_DESOD|nr:sigma 54-interacting transcriptional regulator [Desulfosporosinus orientis]AET67390.1 transcriptional regulator containing PAS, AAA-type ATPase, and DNA-binding domains [Desulfosporosinus orientis DSM 765]
MLAEIVLTSPNQEVTRLVEKMRKELNINLTILEASFTDAVEQVKAVLAENPDRIRVIASGGATLELMREEFPSLNLVSIHPAEYDLVLALDQAKRFGGNVGLLLADSEAIPIIENLSSALRLKVRIYTYHNWQDIEVQVEKAKKDGYQVLLGVGEKISSLVHTKGLQYIQVSAGENTLRSALQRAKDIIEAQIRETLIAKHIDTISVYAHEGIIMVNEDKIVTVFNPVAAKLFGLQEGDVVGRSLYDLSYCRCMFEIFAGLEKRLGFVHRVLNGTVIVNKIPIIDQQVPKGTLVTLREVPKNQEDVKLKKEPPAKGLLAKYCFKDIIHVNPKMSAVIAKAKKYATTDCTVLIRGESGTGKELLAQSMHNENAARRKGPFVAVNCACLDDSLFKSELFGYTEGSFTGASKGGKAGLFEMANNGTLFLDEIGKMKLEQQGNLLRVLQEKEVRRIGSDRIIPVDVRVIAASNENLEELIRENRFREDLYFRLNVLKLDLPPLRERREDIPKQALFFVKKFSEKYGKSINSLPAFILKKLSTMEWHGNSRQLEHFLERCVVLADNEADIHNVIMELLDEEFQESPSDYEEGENLPDGQISVCISTLAEMNSEIVRRVRAKAKVSNSELALKLGISRPTLTKMLNYK